MIHGKDKLNFILIQCDDMKAEIEKIVIQIKKLFTQSTLKKSTVYILRDWYVLLVGAFFVSIVLGLVGVYTFFFFNGALEGKGTTLENVDSSLTFDKKTLEQLVLQYRERSEQFLELKASTSITLEVENVEGGEGLENEDVVETELDESVLNKETLSP